MDKVDEILAQLDQDIPGGMGPMMAPPPLVIDVRQWNKKGLLRDEGAGFKLVWESGAGLVVIALREAVKLRYQLAGERVSQEIPLAWPSSRPLFVCPCGKQVSKLYFAGQRFACRRCYVGILLPPRPKRRARRIPAAARLKALVTSSFQCLGCGTTEGGLVVRNSCRRCEDYDHVDWSDWLYVECRACWELSRRGLHGLHQSLQRIRRLAPERLSVETSFMPSPPANNDRRPHNRDTYQRKTATTRQIRIYENVILGRKKGQNRTHRGHNSAHRVIARLICGYPTGQIATLEGVSRWTVWRRGQLMEDLGPALFPLVKKMMERAARRKDWEEARFWLEALRRAWHRRFLAEYYGRRGVKAGTKSGSGVPKAVVRAWRPHLEAIRDEALGRTSFAA